MKARKPAKDKFAFDVFDDAAQFESLNARLRAATAKDVLLKVLKQIGGVLEKAPQDADAMGSEFPLLAEALAMRCLTRHVDRDVRLSAAYCLTHVLRIHAPSIPYDDDTLRVRRLHGIK